MYKIDNSKSGLCAHITDEFSIILRQSRGRIGYIDISIIF